MLYFGYYTFWTFVQLDGEMEEAQTLPSPPFLDLVRKRRALLIKNPECDK